MILQQYYLGCLAHASYLIGDEASGMAAVVDPQRDVEQYLEDARARGLRIEHVLLTHLHADFLSGHVELRDQVGAAIHIGPGAETEYGVSTMQEGGALELGSVKLGFLETPGHTPESVCILVYDKERSPDRPYAVLTGDTLFIGDVGRPDLGASAGYAPEILAAMLYDSLHEKLLKLPDETLVYPAHGAGSFCGKSMSSETVSTLGEQKRFNYALRPMAKDAFVDLLTSELPDMPRYFPYTAELNRKNRPRLEDVLEEALDPMSLDQVLEAQEHDCQILDTRDSAAFAAAHLRGSINVGLNGSYATWAGALLSHDTPIVIIAEPGAERESAMRLGRIGFDRVLGYLEGGMAALASRPEVLDHLHRLTCSELSSDLSAAPGPLLLDVRSDSEAATGSIQGSRRVPLHTLEERWRDLPRDQRIVVYCASGYRSTMAASILRRRGFDRVDDLIGGYGGWVQTVGMTR